MTNILLGIGEEQKKSLVYDEILKLVIGDDGLWTKNQVTVMVPDGKVNWYSKEFLHKLRVNFNKTAAMNVEFIGYRQFIYRVLDTYGIEEPLSDTMRTLLIGDMIGKSRGAKGDVITSLYDAGEYSQVIGKLVSAGISPEDLEEAGCDENLAKVKSAYEKLLEFSRESAVPISLADSKNVLALDGGENLILQNNYVYCFEFENLNFEDRHFVYDAVKACEKDETFCLAMPADLDATDGGGIYKKAVEVCREIEGDVKTIPDESCAFPGEENRIIYSNNEANNKAKLFKVNDVFAETEFVTKYIYNMVEDQSRLETYRFRDFNVVIPDEGTYLNMLAGMFNKYGMSYAAREKTSAARTSIGAHILDLLRLVDSNYASFEVKEFLKNQPYKITPIKADKLIYKYDFERFEGLDEFCNKIAPLVEDKNTAALLEELKALDADLKTAKTVKNYIEAVYRFLVAMNTSRLFGIDETLAKAGDFDSRKIKNARNTDLVFRALDELHMVYGEAEVSLSEFTKLVEFVFERARASSISKTVDAVNILTASDATITPRPVTMILGLGEENFPFVPKHFGILNDDALKDLEKSGFVVDDRDAETMTCALCRTMSNHTEQLILVHPRLDAGYQINFEPYLLNKLVFTEATQDEQDSLKVPAVDLESADRMREWISYRDRVGEENLDPDIAMELYQRNYMDEDAGGAGGEGAGEEKDEFVRRLQFNVSVIDKFIRCPYMHFLNRGLNANEKFGRALNSRDFGTVMHAMFEKAFEDKAEDGKVVWCFDEARFNEEFGEYLNRASAQISEVLDEKPELENKGLFAARFMLEYYRALRSLVTMIDPQTVSDRSLSDEEKAKLNKDRKANLELPIYAQVGSETHINEKQSVELSNGKTVNYVLDGYIDRVDFDEEHGRYRIIDYKTGGTPKVQGADIEIEDLIGNREASVQLPVYLANCIDDMDASKIGDMGYFATSSKVYVPNNTKPFKTAKDVKIRERVLNAKSNELSLSVIGLKKQQLNEEAFAEIVDLNKRLMNECIDQILSGRKNVTEEQMGRIATDNSSSCTYCPFKNCKYRRLVENEEGGSDDDE